MFYDPYPFKRCSRCNNEYPKTRQYFVVINNKRDRLRTICRKCDNIRRIEWGREFPEKVKTSHKNWRDKNPDKIKSYSDKREQKYPGDGKRRSRQWYDDHREQHKANRDKWRNEHRDQRNISEYHRRSRKRGLPHNFTTDDLDRALKYFDYKCAVCGRPRGLFHTIAMDHWIPLISPDCPGTIPANMVPLCHGQDGCNNKKNRKNPHDWLVEKFGTRKAKQIEKRIQDYFEWVNNI